MINNDKKNFIWNLVGTTLNSFNSLFFLIIVTRLNGENASGVFSFSFSNACLLVIIATYMGRSFQVSDTTPGVSDSDYIYSRLFTTFLMIITALVMGINAEYGTEKFLVFILLVLYKALEAICDVIFGVLQKKDMLYKSGISLTLKFCLGLLLFVLTELLTGNLVYSCIVLVLSSLVILFVYDIPVLVKCDFKLKKFNFNNFKLLLIKGFSMFITYFLSLYVINASKYAIDNNLSDSYQAIYGIIIMPATIVSLAGQFIIQPFLIKLKNAYCNMYFKLYLLIIRNMVLALLAFGIIAVIGATLIGIPFLELLYAINLSGYTLSLVLIIVGAVMRGVSLILSSALIVMNRTFKQMLIYIFASIAAFLISNYFVCNYQVIGASVSYLLVMIIELILYIGVFVYEYKNTSKNNIKNKENVDEYIIYTK